MDEQINWTQAQKNIIRAMARDFDLIEIAEMKGVSYQSVKNLAARARKVIGAHTNTRLVAVYVEVYGFPKSYGKTLELSNADT